MNESKLRNQMSKESHDKIAAIVLGEVRRLVNDEGFNRESAGTVKGLLHEYYGYFPKSAESDSSNS